MTASYEKSKASILADQAKKRALVNEAKAKPCADCGIQYPSYVMQFDHVRGTKLGNIGDCWFAKGKAWLEAEIAKCDVVCANCHAERTYQRMLTTNSSKASA